MSGHAARVAGIAAVLVAVFMLPSAAMSLAAYDPTADARARCAQGAAPVVASGPPRSWLSGAFLATNADAEGANAMGCWRGSPLDAVLVYPSYGTWQQMVDSPGPLNELRGFPGRLVYGLPLLPKDGGSTLADVGAGKADVYFEQLADRLVEAGRGDAVVRVGLEANGPWFLWGATADTADQFRDAARRVMTVMKARAPGLVMAFDISCGHPLRGDPDRVSSLNRLYPGDDLTDVVGCDHFDQYYVAADSPEGWQQALRPTAAAGLQDVADFARAHGKGLAVPEWGVSHGDAGAGDNPEFIELMRRFFEANADVMFLECYFDEPDPYIASSVWGGPRGSVNPRSAAAYQLLW